MRAELNGDQKLLRSVVNSGGTAVKTVGPYQMPRHMGPINNPWVVYRQLKVVLDTRKKNKTTSCTMGTSINSSNLSKWDAFPTGHNK